MAQAWSSLGSQVTLVEAADRLLPNEEPFAGEEVRSALHERGVDVQVGVKATAVRARDGEVEVELDTGGPVRGEQLLVAVGRRPRTDDLGLESVGLEPGKSIEVDDRMRAERLALRHRRRERPRAAHPHGQVPGADRGRHDPRPGRAARSADDARSPRVIFTDPQVAAVGYTLERRAPRAWTSRAVDVPTQSTAGASFYGRDDAPGTSRLVIDDDRGVVVGATFTGVEVGEWLHAATIAVVGEVPLDRLAHAVPAFPTRSEVWLKLLEAYGL